MKYSNITYIIQGPIDRNHSVFLNNIEQGLKLGCQVIVSCSADCDTNIINKLPLKLFKTSNYHTPILRNLKNQLATTVQALENTETEFALKVRSDEKYNVEPFIEAALKTPDKYTTCNIFFIHKCYERYLYGASDHLVFCRTDTMLNGWRLALHNVELFPSTSKRDEQFIFEHWLKAQGIDIDKDPHNTFRNSANCVDIDLLQPYEWKCGGIAYTNSDYLYNNGYHKSIRKIEELDAEQPIQ